MAFGACAGQRIARGIDQGTMPPILLHTRVSSGSDPSPVAPDSPIGERKIGEANPWAAEPGATRLHTAPGAA